MKTFNKIFLCGYMKTGTTSINQALINLGINSTNDDKTPISLYKKGGNLDRDSFINQYQALNIKLNKNDIFYFERVFPKSLYIVTYREPHDIAYSMARHCFDVPIESKPNTFGGEWLYEKARWCDFSQNVKNIENYYTELFDTLFPLRDRVLFIDIIKNSKSAYENLCKFLEIQKPNIEFPHLNKSIYS